MVKTMTVSELENADMENIRILDIRQEKDFEKGSVKNAVHIINIPHNRLDAELELIPGDMPVCVMCYKGESSKEAAEILDKAGFEAYSLEGGYREYLRNWLIKNVSI